MMCFITLFFSFVTASYCYLIIKFIIGWDRINVYSAEVSSDIPEISVSIICPFRNEVAHLPYLFQAINEQSYQKFELILIDDNSADGSREYAEEVSLAFANFRVVGNSGKGKKSAIKAGIEIAQNELIITLDADCIPDMDWLLNIVRFHELKKPDLLILPVKTDSNETWFGDFQQLEFVSLVASGAGASGSGMPILCNGANLCFTKSAWLESEPELHFEEVSGDDIYLLQSVKRRGGEILFLKSKETIAVTQPKEKIVQFIRQRTRWASKKSALKDKDYLFTGTMVFLMSVILVMSFITSIFNHVLGLIFLVLFITKFTVDTIFFCRVKDFFELKHVLLKSLLFSIVYPFYVVFTAMQSLLPRKKW